MEGQGADPLVDLKVAELLVVEVVAVVAAVAAAVAVAVEEAMS